MSDPTRTEQQTLAHLPVLRKSLKVRLTFLSLSIFLVCIWSLAYYISVTLRKDLQLLLGEQLFSTASIVASDINQEIDFRLRSLDKVAAGISFNTLDDQAALQKLIEERPVLQNLFNGGFYVIKADGVVAGDYPRSTGRVGMNVSEKGWMIEALKGRSAIGKPVVGKQLQVPVFTMASPISDAGGTVIGVLAGVIDLKKPSFLDKITGNKYGKTGDYLLIAPQYRLVVTSSDKKRVMQPLPEAGVNPAIDRNIAGFEGYTVLLNPMGVEQLAAMKRIPAVGWYLAVALPTSEAFAPILTMHQRIMLAALLITILSGGLTWWMLRRQLTPILDAVTRLNALTHTDMPVSALPITRQDEVGLLIGAFNRLLEELSKRQALLLENEDRLKSLVSLLQQEHSEKTYLEGQLQQAQKLEAVGRLAGGVAHDFNNNLMIIAGNAELACMDQSTPPKTMEHLQEILKAAQHSRNITAQLLVFSRQQAIAPQTIDANHAITDIQRSLTHLIGKEVSFRLCLGEPLWNVRIDPTQLVQVIINLAVNARDAMPDGGTFTIETGNVTLDPEFCRSIDYCVAGEHVRLSFSDTGTGIDPEIMKQVFDPFFTTKECGKGTGLGLSTVYGIVRQNNGFIDLASEAGLGTTFTIYLPRFEAEQEEATI